jgi:hypothetical protein
MSLKTILSNVYGIAVAGPLFILMSVISFKGGGKYLPMIGAGIGTWLLILSWDRPGFAQLRTHAMAFLTRKWSGSNEKPT